MQKKEQHKVFYDNTDDAFNKQLLVQTLESNIHKIKEALGRSGDLIIRQFNMGEPFHQKVATIYINGLTDKKLMGNFIIEKLINKASVLEHEKPWSPVELGQYILDGILSTTHVEEVTELNKLFSFLLSGQTIVIVDGLAQAYACASQGGELRSITEPIAEPSVRGPKDSFTESLITNTAMVRRRIKSPNLWLETRKLGKITQTEIGIMYLNGIVNDKILEEVRKRIDRIEVDEVIGSNTIEEWISDDNLTPWPTVFLTERPDVVTGNLLEGRVAIFVDGTPIPLIVPATWNQFLQTAEDYYLRWSVAGFLRFLRIVSFLITLLGPSLFIAFVSFHPELIPTPLLINLAAQRQGIPFPIIVEALLMELTFEVLREAGVRMPRPVGQAVSIVGALVLGEAAVMAGIVSSAMVIVVAATAIASFTLPHFSLTDASRLLRFFMMILASTFGLYGIGLGVIILVAHTVSLRSFGIPYLAPFAPFIITDQEDAILRLPKPFLSKRPRLISQNRTNRTATKKNKKTKRDPNAT
ncbi:spore gernimation protein KB [Bacillus sp. SA1-12]|nr:spore gernimation protein KB [Bacillus sp. SA1-12]